MGISYSTAKYLAPAAYVFNFAAQQYGMLATPNMKQIHDENLSFFSPQPYFIAGFFAPQQLVQLAYLYCLWKLSPTTDRAELDTIVDYAPVFALGNLCIGTWMFFWNSAALKTSNIFVVINTTAQLYYMVQRLPKLNTQSTSSILTHLTCKTFAGIGVLDILQNTSVAYFKDVAPSALLQGLTGVGFAAASAASDWIFGGCLVYNLVALSVGQSAYPAARGTAWAGLLGAYAVGAAGIVGARNYLKPPYESKALDGYDALQDEVDDRV